MTDLETARREVIEAVREWCNNVDHREHDLLTVLRRKMRELERIEAVSPLS